MNYEIIKELGIISESELRGIKKEINIVSWNKRRPKIDIREWGPDHEFVGKGLTFDIEEYYALCELANHFNEEIIRILDPTNISKLYMSDNFK